jgi:hypothetical protein
MRVISCKGTDLIERLEEITEQTEWCKDVITNCMVARQGALGIPVDFINETYTETTVNRTLQHICDHLNYIVNVLKSEQAKELESV